MNYFYVFTGFLEVQVFFFLPWPLVINCKNLFTAFIFTGFVVVIKSLQFVIIFLIPGGNAVHCSKYELQLSENRNTIFFIMLGFVPF